MPRLLVIVGDTTTVTIKVVFAVALPLLNLNASYHRAQTVTDWLENNKKIQVEFLPPYAPNLNLIERFWRFAKKELVTNTYYKKHKTFRAKAFQFLNNVEKYKDELKSLMVEKFEIVKPA